jgi:hypothetical protein
LIEVDEFGIRSLGNEQTADARSQLPLVLLAATQMRRVHQERHVADVHAMAQTNARLLLNELALSSFQARTIHWRPDPLRTLRYAKIHGQANDKRRPLNSRQGVLSLTRFTDPRIATLFTPDRLIGVPSCRCHLNPLWIIIISKLDTCQIHI